jgi:glycosyltransferase involved in cell wall biosynthesis
MPQPSAKVISEAGALVEERPQISPFFSVCIPHYSRYPFLREQLETLARQTYRNFEVCISDDFSAEQQRSVSIIEFLKASKLPFAYRLQTENLRYDANLRAAIDLARGEFAVLMGNDDKFADETILELLHHRILEHAPVSAVITNYKEIPSGRVFRRVLRDGVVGTGADVATRTYRNYAFVSGVVLRRAEAIHHRTTDWDGSEMYQMFLGSRTVAAGGRLLGLTDVAVLKDIQIPGLEVDSYRNRRIEYSKYLRERALPVCQIPALVWNAVAPFAQEKRRGRIAWQVLRQMLLFTHPYWMVELRRIHGLRYAFEVCLGMRPRNLTKRMTLPFWARWAARGLFVASSAIGLSFPVSVFEKCSPLLHALAKRNGRPPAARSGIKHVRA